jgi:hypothetical protein
LRVWPELAQKIEIIGPANILAEGDQEERCDIDTSIVRHIGDLAAVRHLACAHLVEHLAWLFFSEIVSFCTLVHSQEGQRAACDLGEPGEILQAGNQAIAPKGTGEPGNACVRIVAIRRQRAKHQQVVHPTLEQAVQEIIISMYCWALKRMNALNLDMFGKAFGIKLA